MKKLNLLVATSFILVAFALSTAQATALNPNAPQGGTFIYGMDEEPESLHPVMATDWYSQRVWEYVLDQLLINDPETWDYTPRIAEKWEISKDKKVFTFHLRKNAFFHDGHPVTAEDVKFSFDAIFEPKYEAAHLRPYYEGIEKAEIVDPYTIKFYAKDTYFLNFDTVATMSIIPKHIYSDVEKSRKMNKEVIGSGPYKIEKYDRGQKIVIKKYDKWYGKDVPSMKGMYNFESVVFKFVKEDNVRLEMLKKGDIDFMERLSGEQYVKKAVGPEWGKSVIKVAAESSVPKSYGYIGWNLQRDLFQDKNVRKALAYLMDREEMNKKFRYGMGIPVAGPVYPQADQASPSVKPILFDLKKGQELLAKAGWADTDKDGVLDKKVNGKKVDFKFTLLYPNKDVEKYFTLYKEDLKKAGIDMEIKLLEWNSFLKLLNDGNFDSFAMAWGANSPEWDPKQIWHSSSAVSGGSNRIHYKVPEVDKMIEKARQESNKAKRIALLRKVYERIAEDAPYAFLFSDKYSMYAHTARIKKPADSFKYKINWHSWWIEPK